MENNNQLSLVMQTPVEELIPKLLAWNGEELLAAVKKRLAAYEGIEYTEDQIVAAKKDRAELNAFRNALNAERIRIGKVYTAPYERFKKEVDTVGDFVKSVVDKIDTQVKTFENAKQEKKLQEIKDYFNSVVGEFSELIPYDKIHNPKWLNSATSFKAIKQEIDNILDDVRKALVAIEALKSEDEDQVKAFYFRTLSLSDALTENKRLQDERAYFAELAARKEAEKAAAQAAAQVEPQAAPTVAADAPKTQTVKFSVTGTVEQLKALQRFLRENNIQFNAI